MKKTRIILFLSLLIFLFVTGCSNSKPGGEDLTMEEYLNKYTYINTKNVLPANGKVGVANIGDPHVFWDEENEKYFMTGTYDGNSFKVWSSEDLTTWDSGTQIFARGQVSWAANAGYLWGAEIHKKGDTYYLYYSTEKDGFSSPRIGVATSDNIYGPYEDKGSAMFDFGYSAIDNHLFTDTDGTTYMYYVRDALDNVVDGVHESHIYIVKVNDDFMSTESETESTMLIRPDQPWELISGGSNWKWVEGCWMHKEGDKYYLFYSANKFNEAAYSIGYAVSDSPTGPFVKNEDNPLIATTANELSGPGNNSFFYSRDGKELFTAYHMHTNPTSPSGNRYLNIDRIGFREDGSIFFNGPTVANQPIPSGSNEYHNLISDEATVTVSSTNPEYNENGINDGEFVIQTKNKLREWVSNDNDLNDSYVELKWDKKQTINSIYIYQPITINHRSLSVSIEFSNGYIIEEVELSQFIGEPGIVHLNGIETEWLKITVNESGFGQTSFGFSEVMVFGSK